MTLVQNPRPSRFRVSGRLAATLAGGMLAAGALTGCSTVEGIVAEQVDNATCAIGSGVIDQVSTNVSDAIAQIQVDPSGALNTLETARTALAAAGATAVEGSETADAIAGLQSTVDDLIALADDAVDGTSVDPQALADLQEQSEAQIKQLVGIC